MCGVSNKMYKGYICVIYLQSCVEDEAYKNKINKEAYRKSPLGILGLKHDKKEH